MNILEALRVRNPGHMVDVEEEFDTFREHYTYYLRVDDRRTHILYTRDDLVRHMMHQRSGKLLYSALQAHVERTIGVRLE